MQNCDFSKGQAVQESKGLNKAVKCFEIQIFSNAFLRWKVLSDKISSWVLCLVKQKSQHLPTFSPNECRFSDVATPESDFVATLRKNSRRGQKNAKKRSSGLLVRCWRSTSFTYTHSQRAMQDVFFSNSTRIEKSSGTASCYRALPQQRCAKQKKICSTSVHQNNFGYVVSSSCRRPPFFLFSALLTNGAPARALQKRCYKKNVTRRRRQNCRRNLRGFNQKKMRVNCVSP